MILKGAAFYESFCDLSKVRGAFADTNSKVKVREVAETIFITNIISLRIVDLSNSLNAASFKNDRANADIQCVRLIQN